MVEVGRRGTVSRAKVIAHKTNVMGFVVRRVPVRGKGAELPCHWISQVGKDFCVMRWKI